MNSGIKNVTLVFDSGKRIKMEFVHAQARFEDIPNTNDRMIQIAGVVRKPKGKPMLTKSESEKSVDRWFRSTMVIFFLMLAAMTFVTAMTAEAATLEDATKSCDDGNMQSCHDIAVAYDTAGAKESGVSFYDRACRGGLLSSCSNLGMTKESMGHRDEAEKLYAKACDGGFKMGCDNLAALKRDQLDAAARDAYQKKYGIAVCARPDLFGAIYNPLSNEIEQNCVYDLRGPLKVLQVVKDGVLVTQAQKNLNLPDKVFLVRTKKPYVDGDRVEPMPVRAAGAVKHLTVLGVESTIQSFEAL